LPAVVSFDKRAEDQRTFDAGVFAQIEPRQFFVRVAVDDAHVGVVDDSEVLTAFARFANRRDENELRDVFRNERQVDENRFVDLAPSPLSLSPVCLTEPLADSSRL